METSNQLSGVLAERSRSLTVDARSSLPRMSPGGYLALSAILTFAALIVCELSVTYRANPGLRHLILVPLLVLTDRLSFDGVTLKRSGFGTLPRRIFQRNMLKIAIADIEKIEVTSLRTLRRGGNVRYRYRVEISGSDSSVSFASGGRQFRRMVQALLPQIGEHKLDARACELRDHLVEAKAARSEARDWGLRPLWFWKMRLRLLKSN